MERGCDDGVDVVALGDPAEARAGVGEGAPGAVLVLGGEAEEGVWRCDREEGGHEVDGVRIGLVEAADAEQAEPGGRGDAGLFLELAERGLPSGFVGLNVPVDGLLVAGESVVVTALQEQDFEMCRGAGGVAWELVGAGLGGTGIRGGRFAQEVDADQIGCEPRHQGADRRGGWPGWGWPSCDGPTRPTSAPQR